MRPSELHSFMYSFIHWFGKNVLWTYYVSAVKQKFQIWREVPQEDTPQGAVGAHGEECHIHPRPSLGGVTLPQELDVCLPISLIWVFKSHLLPLHLCLTQSRRAFRHMHLDFCTNKVIHFYRAPTMCWQDSRCWKYSTNTTDQNPCLCKVLLWEWRWE